MLYTLVSFKKYHTRKRNKFVIAPKLFPLMVTVVGTIVSKDEGRNAEIEGAE